MLGLKINLTEIPVLLNHDTSSCDSVHFKALGNTANVGQHTIGPNLYFILSINSQSSTKLNNYCFNSIDVTVDAIDTSLGDRYSIST